MAQRRKPAADPQAPITSGVPVGEPELTEAELADEQELDEAIALVTPPGAAKVLAWRYVKDADTPGGDWERIPGVIPASVFNPDQLAIDYGGGLFRFQFKDTKGQIIKTPTVKFATPPAPAPGVQLAGPPAYLDTRRQDDDRKFMRELVLALAGRSQPAGPSLTELITAVASLRQITGDTGGSSTTEAADLMLKGIEVVERARESGAGGGSTTMLDMAREAMGLLKTLASAPARRRLPAPVGAAAGRSAGEVGAAPAPRMIAQADQAGGDQAGGDQAGGDQAGGEQVFLSLARRYAPWLIARARAEKDPWIVGQFLVEECPDDWRDVLIEFVTMDYAERWNVVRQVAPDMEAHRGWFDELCKGAADLVVGDKSDGGEDSFVVEGAPEGSEAAAAAGRNGDLADGRDHSKADPAGRDGSAGSPGGRGAGPGNPPPGS